MKETFLRQLYEQAPRTKDVVANNHGEPPDDTKNYPRSATIHGLRNQLVRAAIPLRTFDLCRS